MRLHITSWIKLKKKKANKGTYISLLLPKMQTIPWTLRITNKGNYLTSIYIYNTTDTESRKPQFFTSASNLSVNIKQDRTLLSISVSIIVWRHQIVIHSWILRLLLCLFHDKYNSDWLLSTPALCFIQQQETFVGSLFVF
jgi:hypothetical protein